MIQLSIQRKLLLLLLSTVGFVLLLVGVGMDRLIERFHEEKAHEQFLTVFREVEHDLMRREERLRGNLAALAQRDFVIASVNMIHRYARPEDYQPLVFDAEKQILIREMDEQLQGGWAGQFTIFDARGNLLAFYLKQQEETAGFVSYKGGQPQVMVRRGRAGEWRPGELPESVLAQSAPSDAVPATVSFRRCGEGFALQVAAPVLRAYPDGSTQRVGSVIGTEFVNADFARDIARRTGLQFDLMFKDGSSLTPFVELNERIRSAPLMHGTDHSGHIYVDHPEYFLAGSRLQLVGGEEAYAVSGIRRSVVADEAARARRLVLSVLLLTALLILPVGAALFRRIISQPVSRLLKGVEALQRGDFSAKVEPHRDDELGRLAGAFNAMAASLAQRQAELAESEGRYRTLMDNMPLSAFFKDTDSVYRSCNLHYANDRGFKPEEIIGKTDYDFYPEELAERYRAGDRALMEGGKVLEFEEPNLQHGQNHVVHTTKAPVWDASGKIMGVLGIYWDITERKRTEDRLRQAAAVFESTAEAVMITDADRRIIAVNKAFTEITGYSEAEVIGENPRLLRSERQDSGFYREMWKEILRTGRWQGEIWNRRKGGEVHPEWMTISVVRDEHGNVGNYVAVFSDISSIKKSQEQLDHMAHHDPLTNLPNRLLLSARLEHAFEHARREQHQVAVLFLDLDRFKIVNDTLGHPVGDQLLQVVAQRLRDRLRQCDTVARLGGDEFVVTIDDVTDTGEVGLVASKLLEVFDEPFQIDQHELQLGCSIGISLFPQDGEDVATLVKNADTAMYESKSQGRNTFRFYTSELSAEAEQRFHLELGLRHALERDELTVYYQPQVDLASGAIRGAEALLRWRHPEMGLVPPDRFIPLAEESGLILPIGTWVLEQACQQFMVWRAAGLPLERISVNLSGRQVQRGDLVETTRRILNRIGMPAECLELEITESILMHQPNLAAVVLGGLRELGVELAIDDFGTGYSSLSYLKRFPITNLKIDKSFVRDIPDDPNDEAIIRAVIALAENLQLRVTAEGVENEEQRLFLMKHGCDHGQGYYYSRPVPAEAFEALVARGAQKELPTA